MELTRPMLENCSRICKQGSDSSHVRLPIPYKLCSVFLFLAIFAWFRVDNFLDQDWITLFCCLLLLSRAD